MNNPLTFKSNDPNVWYVEVCELGEGEESFVYLARKVSSRSEDDVLVAVKQSKKEENRTKATGRNLIERFQFQAEHAAQLHHPNIVEVIEFVDPQETAEQQRRARPHLVMEYVEGVTLRQKMKPRRANGGLVGTALPLEDILSISEQTLSGLSHTHAQNPAIIHRDIRPEQLMITPDGRVKILDFGLAKELWSLDAEFVRTMITTGGGTWDYMAPEQIGLISKIVGEDVVPINYVPGTDVYTFGVTLYEMARGVVLPRKKEHGSMEHYVPHDADLTFLGGKIDLRPLIVKATQYDIDKRYPSAKAFLEALQQLREKYDAIVKGRGARVSVPTELEPIDAEFEEVNPTGIDAVAETAIAKPTGALMPKEIENIEALLPVPPKPWYIRWAPLIGPVVGAVAADALIDSTGIYVGKGAGYSVIESLKHLYSDESALIAKTIEIVISAAGGLIGGLAARMIYKSTSPPTRALAAPDESYKEKGLAQRVGEYLAQSKLRIAATLGAGTGGAIALESLVKLSGGNINIGTLFAIAGVVLGMYETHKFIEHANKKREFREDHNTLLKRCKADDIFGYGDVSIRTVLEEVESRYGFKARQTVAHNYATKMLEEGKYDEVEKTGADLVNRLIAASNKGRFRAWRERRQGRVLLEDIGLGLISKGKVRQYANLRTGSEYFLGKERVAQLDALARDRLRSVHHDLYGRKEDDADVKQYAALCRAFYMEPNLEKLTRALVPMPMEEARGTVADNVDMLRNGEYHAVMEVIEEKVRQFAQVTWETVHVPEQPGDYKGIQDYVPAHTVYTPQTQEISQQEKAYVQDLLYGLLNKGAWKELAELRKMNRDEAAGNLADIFDQKQMDKFDATVLQRLEEVKPYLKDATPVEREAYRTACVAFRYQEGANEVEILNPLAIRGRQVPKFL